MSALRRHLAAALKGGATCRPGAAEARSRRPAPGGAGSARRRGGGPARDALGARNPRASPRHRDRVPGQRSGPAARMACAGCRCHAAGGPAQEQKFSLRGRGVPRSGTPLSSMTGKMWPPKACGCTPWQALAAHRAAAPRHFAGGAYRASEVALCADWRRLRRRCGFAAGNQRGVLRDGSGRGRPSAIWHHGGARRGPSSLRLGWWSLGWVSCGAAAHPINHKGGLAIPAGE